MFGAILKAPNSSFKKGIAFCHSIYVKKVMKLLAFTSLIGVTEGKIKKEGKMSFSIFIFI